MRKVNRGKQFEDAIKQAFEKECYTLRLYDTTNGFVGIANPCDYIAYKKPHMFMIECKSCYGASLPIANISQHQRDSLLIADKYVGMIAGYMIWFIDKDRTFFIRATDLEKYIKSSGRKSIPFDLTNLPIDIDGKKKRIMYEYDMKGFLDIWDK